MQEGLNRDSVSTEFKSNRQAGSSLMSGEHVPTQSALEQLRDTTDLTKEQQTEILQEWSRSTQDVSQFPEAIQPYSSKYRPLDELLSGSTEYPSYWGSSYRKALAFYSTLNAFNGANGFTMLTDFLKCVETTGQAAVDCARTGRNCKHFESREMARSAYDEFVALRPLLENLKQSWNLGSISELARLLTGLV